MASSDTLLKKWYVTIIAGFFLPLCGMSSLRYIAMDFSLIGGSVPVSTQILCFSATISAALYFFRPLIGCVGLLVISCYGLMLSAQASDAEAVVFYVIVSLALTIGAMAIRRREEPTIPKSAT